MICSVAPIKRWIATSLCSSQWRGVGQDY